MDAFGLHLQDIQGARRFSKEKEKSLGIQLEKGRRADKLLRLHHSMPGETISRPGWVSTELLEWTAGLVRTSRAGQSARQDLIESCLHWAVRLTCNHAKFYHARAADLLDWAHLGLIDAVDTFDYRRGRLTTHAYYRVRRFLLGPANWEKATIRHPRYQNRPSNMHRRYVIADAVKRRARSLDRPLSQSRRPAALSEYISDPRSSQGFDRVDTEDMATAVRMAVKTLSERYRTVLLRRVDGDTLEEIAADMGITKERVRQLQLNAVRLVRRYIRKCTTR